MRSQQLHRPVWRPVLKAALALCSVASCCWLLRLTLACRRVRAETPPTPAHPNHPQTLCATAQEFGLHNFASEFAGAGLAVFVFDYRGWGGSSGGL